MNTAYGEHLVNIEQSSIASEQVCEITTLSDDHVIVICDIQQFKLLSVSIKPSIRTPLPLR